MAKRKQRHLSKDEICQAMRNVKRDKFMAEEVPYMGINTIALWVLWRKFGFDKKAVVKFDCDYTRYATDEKFSYDDLNRRMYEKTGNYIEFDWLEEKDFMQTGNKFLDGLNTHNAYINNRLHYGFAEYLVIMYNVFIDYGYTYEKMSEIDKALAEEINERVSVGTDGHMTSFWDYWNDLRNNLGVEVKRVDVSNRIY